MSKPPSDLIAVSKGLETAYRLYLSSTFTFRDPDFRNGFRKALADGSLSKGPYLEATPVFSRAGTTADVLCATARLQFEHAFLAALHGHRPLYLHQERAIQRLADGGNAVVATGTGSGKTEAFLFPILQQLYAEDQRGDLTPGVRALVLYPMNALANDQRERLGTICERLAQEDSAFRFTFGEYVGSTPEDERDSFRNGAERVANRLHGELVTRKEIRESPPHILLTNYSMLEYLLLRPDDSPLFDGGSGRTWRFLVLDEAHQYGGAKGIEMAMLIRRLKRRVREGGATRPLQCIATSATIATGAEDKHAVAEFAAALFGEAFSADDVIFGNSEIALPEQADFRLAADDYSKLAKALGGSADPGLAEWLESKAREVGATADLPAPEAAGQILVRDQRYIDLLKLLEGTPRNAEWLATQLFSDLDERPAVKALGDLVNALSRATLTATGGPLLSARYHYFLRSLEGTFVAYHPEKRVFLDRRGQDGGSPVFEVAICLQCGQHYLLGRKGQRAGRLSEPVRDPAAGEFGVAYFRPLDEGETAENEEWLCGECGELSVDPNSCEHATKLRVAAEDPPSKEDRADQLPRCGRCGYNAGGRDPVREVIYGSDGPHAVLATKLYRSLPEDRRKVLAFADGRQQAAFFAWFLEDTYRSLVTRSLIYRSLVNLKESGVGSVSLRTLTHVLAQELKSNAITPAAADDLEIQRSALHRVLAEMMTEERRISLEGVGLLRWTIPRPQWIDVPRVLMNPPWQLDELGAWAVVEVLLDTMRSDSAVELQGIGTLSVNWDELGVRSRQRTVRLGPPRSGGHRFQAVRDWAGNRGSRADYLGRALIQTGLAPDEAGVEAVRTLREIWQSLQDGDSQAPGEKERLLVRVSDARRLNSAWLRAEFAAPETTVYECNICTALHPTVGFGICRRYRCPGTLISRQLDSLNEDHYRSLYESDLPTNIRVEEHTAQLETEKARQFQEEFREGKIDILSCSTTFELGVDLGNLDSVFLRNVPPEAFNYAQRVGRAGRRAGHPGYALTFCRRGPHDLYHFADPARLLQGEVRPPVISLKNEKIAQRHVTALILAGFFRSDPQRFKSVQDFVGDMANPAGLRAVRAFARAAEDVLARAVEAILPKDLMGSSGSATEWIGRSLSADDSRLADAEAVLKSDYLGLEEFKRAAVDAERFREASWAKHRLRTIAEENLLTFLSRNAVIPKYGFPVDVVRLDALWSSANAETATIDLQRDLSIAIAEFAPTSQLVANKQLWTSAGLKRVAEKEWPRKAYKVCRVHNVFQQWDPADQEPPTPCKHPLQVGEYIEPRFGFVTDRGGPKTPSGRTPRVFSTRPYFAGTLAPAADHRVLSIGKSGLQMRAASPGWMVVLCEGRRGQGFYICQSCGSGFRSRQKEHSRLQGGECSGALKRVALGHEFVTDVLELQIEGAVPRGMESIWFGYSLVYALVEGAAEVLQTPSRDLNGTVLHAATGRVPPLVLYDDVPGGAGLVARLESPDALEEVLAVALQRVSGQCGCEPETSCYGCLRSYRNSFAHQHLSRGAVRQVLENYK